MRCMICFLLLFVVVSLKAQLVDDFSDGNFTHDPVWDGHSESFRVNTDHQLQLFTSGSGTAWLVTANLLSDSTVWQFRIKLGFSPSSNNFARIYLVSDQSDLTGALNGYYLQLGESGMGDALELFRQEGLSSQSICRGKEGGIAQSFSLKIKVTHQQDGAWSIFSAPESSNVYQMEASGSDHFQSSAAYFGIRCTFTSSNSQKFFFDDFLIQLIQKDTLPPSVEQVLAISSNQLNIWFSESVNASDATHPSHYRIESNGNIPDSASTDFLDPRRVRLYFSSSFTNGSWDDLHIMNIHDPEGNLLQDTIIRFSFYIPQAFDVLINEIMADPDPSVSLPPVEYLELYNVSSWPVSLEEWSICVADNPKIFPQISMPSNSYLLITKGDDLEGFGPGVALLTSSYSLSNEGTAVSLVNPLQQLIHSVTYSDGWCRDNWKQEGGWSLELMDPLNPCTEDGNWAVCTDPMGGTPGRVNSGLTVNRDTTSPRLSRIGFESADGIRIWYSEKVDSATLLNPMIYRIEPSVGHPVEVASSGDFYQSLRARLPTPLQETLSYRLEVLDSIADCAGNRLASGSWLPVGIPVIAGNMDLIINEILLDPYDDGADFIEIYNRTDRFYDLKDMVLARLDTISLLYASVQPICSESFLLAPGRFMVLSPDPSAVIRQYHCPDPDAFLKMAKWPSFNQEASVIVLANKHDEQTIDQVSYRESLHFDLISNPEGVSLERIHYNRPSDDPTNWHSASRSSGFATPGYQNSQFTNDIVQSDHWLMVEPELFTPDNDGIDDLLSIHCSESEPGFVINIQIFDSEGKKVKFLVNNALMGMSNSFTWDGKNERGAVVRSGIYIILAQVFDLNGKVRVAKRPCVLVNQNAR